MKRENFNKVKATKEQLEEVEAEIKRLQSLLDESKGADLIIKPAGSGDSLARASSKLMETDWIVRYVLMMKEKRREELLAYLESL